MIDTPVQIVQPQAEDREFINHAHRWMFPAVAVTIPPNVLARRIR